MAVETLNRKRPAQGAAAGGTPRKRPTPACAPSERARRFRDLLEGARMRIDGAALDEMTEPTAGADLADAIGNGWMAARYLAPLAYARSGGAFARIVAALRDAGTGAARSRAAQAINGLREATLAETSRTIALHSNPPEALLRAERAVEAFRDAPEPIGAAARATLEEIRSARRWARCIEGSGRRPRARDAYVRMLEGLAPERAGRWNPLAQNIPVEKTRPIGGEGDAVLHVRPAHDALFLSPTLFSELLGECGAATAYDAIARVRSLAMRYAAGAFGGVSTEALRNLLPSLEATERLRASRCPYDGSLRDYIESLRAALEERDREGV